MNDLHSFLTAVLGPDGATALQKAGERSEALASFIAPRAIVGWVQLASRWEYEGEVPGIDDSQLDFHKSEDGLLAGSIALGGEQLDFQAATVDHLAAMMCVGLGCSGGMSKSLQDARLADLGANIDLLVRARVVNLLKAEEASACSCCEACNTCRCSKWRKCDCGDKCKKTVKKPVEKAELPGKQAAPNAPLAPVGQTAPTAKQAAQKPKLPTVKLTKAQGESRCTVCEAKQFDKRGDFCGCFCFRDLGHHALAKKEADGGYTLTFNSNWTRNNIALLMDIVGAHEDV